MTIEIDTWLRFDAPRQVTLRQRAACRPGPHEVRVQVVYSAISPGTELLIWRGELPASLPADETLPALAGQPLAYPLAYGYACVGRICELGAGVDSTWLGRRVFAFRPHASAFCAPVSELQIIPDDVSWQAATFLANMETACTLVLDGQPLLGERVLVLGQGVVGLLTTAILTQFPLEQVAAIDPLANRRTLAAALGATPLEPAALPDVFSAQKADLTFELSGRPEVLNQAIAHTAFSGRVVIGSWYGNKTAPLELGGRFHRSRIRLIASQVSTLPPELSGRWDKARRFRLAWQMLRQVQPERLVSHVLPAAQAATAYRLLAEAPDQTVQVLLQWADDLANF